MVTFGAGVAVGYGINRCLDLKIREEVLDTLFPKGHPAPPRRNPKPAPKRHPTDIPPQPIDPPGSDGDQCWCCDIVDSCNTGIGEPTQKYDNCRWRSRAACVADVDEDDYFDNFPNPAGNPPPGDQPGTVKASICAPPGTQNGTGIG